jgi:Fe-S-cluster-containing dehydrogenase component
MSVERRAFLKKGLAAGAAAVGIAGCRPGISGEAGAEGVPAGEPTTALTVDGRLVQINGAPARPLPPSDPAVRRGVPGRKWVMVIDLAACDGCSECTLACNVDHHIPAGREWLRVFRMQDSPDTTPYWFPKPCFQCDNPPCTKVCPVDATFKREDGIVLIDNERCIGCRFCMAACPYSTRVFNWARTGPTEAELAYSPETGLPRQVGTVEKCDFCPEMLGAGLLPACVMACSMGAIYMGDQNDDAVTNGVGETVQLSKLLVDRAGYRHMADLGTQPRVFYLPPSGRRYPPPEAPRTHAGHHDAHASSSENVS